VPCVVGTYSMSLGASTADACVPCVANKYSTTVGAQSISDCIVCDSEAGKYSEIVVRCVACERVASVFCSATRTSPHRFSWNRQAMVTSASFTTRLCHYCQLYYSPKAGHSSSCTCVHRGRTRRHSNARHASVW
jgi:hypothetical protein